MEMKKTKIWCTSVSTFANVFEKMGAVKTI